MIKGIERLEENKKGEYLIIKLSDAEKYLDIEELALLAKMVLTIKTGNKSDKTKEKTNNG